MQHFALNVQLIEFLVPVKWAWGRYCNELACHNLIDLRNKLVKYSLIYIFITFSYKLCSWTNNTHIYNNKYSCPQFENIQRVTLTLCTLVFMDSLNNRFMDLIDYWHCLEFTRFKSGMTKMRLVWVKALTASSRRRALTRRTITFFIFIIIKVWNNFRELRDSSVNSYDCRLWLSALATFLKCGQPVKWPETGMFGKNSLFSEKRDLFTKM